MKEKQNTQGEFEFLKEHINDGESISAPKFIAFLVSCGVIVGIVACIVFLWVKPRFMGNKKDNSDLNSAEITDKIENDRDNYTGGNGENETGSTEKPVDNASAEASVVTLVVNQEIKVEESREENDIYNVESEEIEAGNVFIDNVYFSGLIWSVGKEVIIIAEDRLLEKSGCISVCFGETIVKGKVVSRDKDYGICVVSVKTSDLPKETLASIRVSRFAKSSEYKVGDEIKFIGNPYEKDFFIANGSLTSVRNVYNIVDTEFEIMSTSISKVDNINGFAFDASNRVVGMFNCKMTDEQNSDNIIEIVTLDKIIEYIYKVVNKEEIPYFGIYGQEVTEEAIANIDKEMPRGVYVKNRKEDSPAYNVGIMNGDIIVAIGGKKIEQFADYNKALINLSKGEIVKINVMRKGKDGYKQIEYSVETGGKK